MLFALQGAGTSGLSPSFKPAKGSSQNAIDVARFCQIFYPATSLGGVESLIEHRATVEGPKSAVPQNLLRLSIGTEDSADLIDDLEMALSSI